MRTRAYRRHQTQRHMWRRLKEDRNQHYDSLDCPCWTDKKAMAMFKEQPKRCSRYCCWNPRRHQGWPAGSVLTIQERRAQESIDSMRRDDYIYGMTNLLLRRRFTIEWPL